MSLTALADLVSLCKRRGFIYPGSAIYGGYKGFWDYGPLGVALKRNLKDAWWQTMVTDRDDVVGLDAAIIMNPEVWRASGHLDSFTDPLVECKHCHQRFRSDEPTQLATHEATHDQPPAWTEPKKFNLLTEVLLGATEPKSKAYLRGEITQGVFVNFAHVVASTRIKIPFGIAQIGKAFRNEITPGNFTFRSLEFEQMELEYFVPPDDSAAPKIFTQLQAQRLDWYVKLGLQASHLRFREHQADERAHYARLATDIEYHTSFGWKECEGIHHRGDWDLSHHHLTYHDPETNATYTPYVLETSVGVDRAALFFLLDAYELTADRVILKLHPRLAPYQVAVFPLLKNKPELVKTARQVKDRLKANFRTAWDDRGNIGKRYYAQDEIGTLYGITIDFTTLQDETVTVRHRDTTAQVRVSLAKLVDYLNHQFKA